MIGGVEIEILDIEQKTRAGLAADQVEKLGIRQVGVRPFECVGDVFEQEGHGDSRLDRPDLADDHLGDRLGLRQRQQVGEVAAGDPRERKMLAVGGRLEAFDDGRDPVEIAEVERNIGADREPDAVSVQRNAADQFKDFRTLPCAAVDAVIDRHFEYVEAIEIGPRPVRDRGTVAEAYGGRRGH